MRLRFALIGAALALAATLPHQSAGAAAPSGTLRSSMPFAPVVIEWFSTVRPSVGQREVVFVRFVNNNKPVSGAQLKATLRLGKQTLGVAHGSTTDRAGKAQASFIVPAAARGKMLRVVVSLSYKRHTYRGRNDLRIAG